MSSLGSYIRVWRLIVLLALAVAIVGPWIHERLHVPSKYPCTPPNIRLEGDFCGSPVSGMIILSWMVGGFFYTIGGLLTGGTSLAGAGTELLSGLLVYLLLFLLLLPFITTLLLFLRGDRRRWQVSAIASWGLAVGAVLLIVLSSYPKFYWTLWGVWLYIGLAILTLVLEIIEYRRM